MKARHPGIRFALDTYTPWGNTEHVPRNMQVWNFHSYYLWSVYDVLERAITWGEAAEEPVVGEDFRRYLRREPVPYREVHTCRGDRPPMHRGEEAGARPGSRSRNLLHQPVGDVA